MAHPAETQRAKLAFELSKIKRGCRNLYILDESTTGGISRTYSGYSIVRTTTLKREIRCL
jgi:hypothetical protein